LHLLSFRKKPYHCQLMFFSYKVWMLFIIYIKKLFF